MFVSGLNELASLPSMIANAGKTAPAIIADARPITNRVFSMGVMNLKNLEILNYSVGNAFDLSYSGFVIVVVMFE